MPKKSSSKSHTRKHKNASRSSSAVERDVKLLKDWVTRDVELELILHLPGVTISYKGQIVELSSDTDELRDFMFLSSAGKMNVLLFPWIWQKTETETLANIWLQLHIWQKGKLQNITLRESLRKPEPNAKLEPVLTQLRSWATVKTELAIFIQHRSYALFFLAEAIEIADGQFSFPERRSRHIQLVVAVHAFSRVCLEERNGYPVVELIDADAKSVISVSTAPARTEVLFQRFKIQSRLIH